MKNNKISENISKRLLNFGAELDLQLKAKGLTRSKAAIICGIHASALSRWVGGSNITLENICLLEEKLGLKLLALSTRKDEKSVYLKNLLVIEFLIQELYKQCRSTRGMLEAHSLTSSTRNGTLEESIRQGFVDKDMRVTKKKAKNKTQYGK